MKTVLPEIAAGVRKDAVVISLAPVVGLARLSEMLGVFGRLARLLPNAPSLVRSGFNPVGRAAGLPADARGEIEGGVRTFFDSGLTAAQVIDLVAVRPLAAAEPQIRQAYRDALPKLYAKLKGA